MSGRPVRLLAAATIAAAASVFSMNAASAGCFSCGSSYTYAAPVAYYTAPVVYSYSYAAPAAYAAPCNCGYAAPAPMYVVNQGPAYNAPVTGYAEPLPSYGYRSAYPYAEGGLRWRHRHWHHRGYGVRFGAHRYRYGAVVPGMRRFSMRHPMVGPHGIHRPMMGMHRPHAMGMVPHKQMRPGTVHTMGGPKKHKP